MSRNRKHDNQSRWPGIAAHPGSCAAVEQFPVALVAQEFSGWMTGKATVPEAANGLKRCSIDDPVQRGIALIVCTTGIGGTLVVLHFWPVLLQQRTDRLAILIYYQSSMHQR